MGNDIIEQGTEPDIVDINGQNLSMQTLQHIYNEVTGRSEELSRRYTINHHITINDLRQLNIKITQLYEQYNVKTQNCAVTLYHLDDQKQVFSSFERFEYYDKTTLSPVENIRLEYNLLIILPKVQKPQSYKIEINIQSRAAIYQRAKSESNLPHAFLYQIITATTAALEIKYIDYTVARNFQVAIDGWFKSLPLLPSYKWLKPMQRISNYLPIIFKIASMIFYLVACYIHFSNILSDRRLYIKELYSTLVITGGGVVVLSLVASTIGSFLESSIQRILPASYINLTRGDEIAFEKFTNENKHGWIRTIISIISIIIINIVSCWLAVKIGITK